MRAIDPHAEGMLVNDGKGLGEGYRPAVKLIATDPERSSIDFAA